MSIKFLSFAPSRQRYDLSNGLCYPPFQQLELELLFDSDQSYSQYGIILLISLYLFFIFAGISNLIMEVFPPLSNTWCYCTKNRLEIYRFRKDHGNAGKSWSIHVAKKSTHLQIVNILWPTVMVTNGKKTHRHYKVKSKAK